MVGQRKQTPSTPPASQSALLSHQYAMPVALAPSNVMPKLDKSPPLTTESASAFVDYGAAGRAARPYRGVIATQEGGIVSRPTLYAQLESLGSRLEAMRKLAAPADEPASEPAPESSSDAVVVGAMPWESQTYDSFAKFAGEASRVANTGRLAFGSDNKKMAL